MPREYAALEIVFAAPPTDEELGLLLADLDGDDPVAVELVDPAVRVFFSSAAGRDRAAATLRGQHGLAVAAVDVSDEDWAARSQASLRAVRAGEVLVAPPWDDTPAPVRVVIQPSMGFGTGHHATTRLCLRLLQDCARPDMRVLDVGTGSGVLAIAAARLGAARVLAIDNDPDALRSARENVDLNGVGDRVTLAHVALGADHSAPGAEHQAPIVEHRFDLVLANLTGATLVRLAPRLAAAVAPGGRLIVSGILREELEEVAGAFRAHALEGIARLDEDGWAALALS